MENLKLQEALENLVDLYGLAPVLSELATICHEKADHIESNWQDVATAKMWSREAVKLEKVSGRVTV